MNSKIFKIDAARRQLEVACRLYFNDGDIVSIHTLTHAAHELLDNIAEKRNVSSLKRDVINAVKPEYRGEFIKKMNEAANFFKHADKDPDSYLDFNNKTTELDLFDAVLLYFKLTNEWPFWFLNFYNWYIISNPTIIDYERSPELKIVVDSLVALDFKDKYEYIESSSRNNKSIFKF